MGESLQFRALRLNNWKNFVKAEVDIQHRLFLIGPNAAGKSNFLDVFRFLRDLVSPGGGFQEAVNRRGGVSAIRCLAARQQSLVEIHVTLRQSGGVPSWIYDLSFTQDSQRRPLVNRERVLRDTQELLARPNSEDRSDAARLTQTALEQVNVNREFRDVATFFASIRYLHIVPQLVREPERSVGRTGDPYGGDFLEQVARTQDRTRKARLRRLCETLRVAVPQLQEIELARDVRGTPHLRARFQHWRPQGAWQTEEQFSDGTLRLMGLLWATMDREGPLLLEEPELSLHPDLVRRLPEMFARVRRRTGRQIFLSTHSPDLLHDEGIGLDEVLLLTPGPERTEVSLASTHREIRELLDGGVPLSEIVIPRTRPHRGGQLSLFPDL